MRFRELERAAARRRRRARCCSPTVATWRPRPARRRWRSSRRPTSLRPISRGRLAELAPGRVGFEAATVTVAAHAKLAAQRGRARPDGTCSRAAPCGQGRRRSSTRSVRPPMRATCSTRRLAVEPVVGRTEAELAWWIELTLRDLGAEDVSFASDRRERPERGAAAPPSGRPAGRGGRDVPRRLGLHRRRVLLRLHAHVRDRVAARRSSSARTRSVWRPSSPRSTQFGPAPPAKRSTRSRDGWSGTRGTPCSTTSATASGSRSTRIRGSQRARPRRSGRERRDGRARRLPARARRHPHRGSRDRHRRRRRGADAVLEGAARHGIARAHGGPRKGATGPPLQSSAVAETISTNQFKNGMHVELDGQVWRIVEFQHVKPGKGGAFVRTKLKNAETGVGGRPHVPGRREDAAGPHRDEERPVPLRLG